MKKSILSTKVHPSFFFFLSVGDQREQGRIHPESHRVAVHQPGQEADGSGQTWPVFKSINH